MAREASTYRGARRNYCIRELKMVWGPNWYYKDHRNKHGGPEPIYRPAARILRKLALGKNDIHAMLKRGDYAAAVRKMYERGEHGKARVSEASGASGSSSGAGDAV